MMSEPKPRFGESMDAYRMRLEAWRDRAARPPLGKGEKRCLDCDGPMTWAARRVQEARLKKRGISEAHRRLAMPRCQKCMTIYLRFFHDDTRRKPGPRRRQQWVDGIDGSTDL